MPCLKGSCCECPENGSEPCPNWVSGSSHDAQRWQLLEGALNNDGITEIKLDSGSWLRIVKNVEELNISIRANDDKTTTFLWTMD